MAHFTQAQIDKLIEALGTGAERVRYADRSVDYRSLDELLKLLGHMQDDVLPRTKIRHIRVNSSKGFDC